MANTLVVKIQNNECDNKIKIQFYISVINVIFTLLCDNFRNQWSGGFPAVGWTGK